MHPIDRTEIALKKAARSWRSAENSGNSTGECNDRNEAWQAFKVAARNYADAWNTYVIPAEGK